MAGTATAPAIAWDDEAQANSGPQIQWDEEKPQGKLDTALRTGLGIERFTASAKTGLPRVETFADRRQRLEGQVPQMFAGPGGAVAASPGGTERETGQKLNPLDLNQMSRIGHRAALDEDQRLASRAARTGQVPSFGERASDFGLHAAASATDLARGATNGKGLATAGAATVAPEIVLPYLALTGGAQMIEHAPGALRADPDELEQSLYGASQLVGSVAGTGEALRPGFEAARTEGASVSEAIGRGFMETRTGRAASAINRNVIQPIGDRVTPPPAPKALRQAIQPGVNVPKIDESIPIAGARIQQLREAGALVDRNGEPLTEIKSPAQLVDAVKSSKAHIWDKLDERFGPISDVARADTAPVADAMEKSISGRTSKQFAGEAGTIRERAETYRGQMTLREIEDAIQDANDDLKGYYQRSAGSNAPTSAGMRATLAEVRALRSLLDEKVQDLRGAGVADLKREYGALRDVERAAAKAEFVNARQKGMPLYEALAMLRAAGDFVTGNVLGAARGAATLAMGRYLTKLRDPNYLIEQSFHGPQAFKSAEAIAKPPIDVVQGEFAGRAGPRAAARRPVAPTYPAAAGRGLPDAARPELAPWGLEGREAIITPQPSGPGLLATPYGNRAEFPRRLLPAAGQTAEPATGLPREPIIPGAQRALPPANPVQTARAATPEYGIRTVGGRMIDRSGNIAGYTAEGSAKESVAAPAQQVPQAGGPRTDAERRLEERIDAIDERLKLAKTENRIRTLTRERKQLVAQLGEARQKGAKYSVEAGYAVDVVQTAKEELQAALSLWDELPPPGRSYYEGESPEERIPSRMKHEAWSGTNSPRKAVEDMYPWVAKMKGYDLSDLKAALRQGKGAAFDRWLQAAADYVSSQGRESGEE